MKFILEKDSWTGWIISGIKFGAQIKNEAGNEMGGEGAVRRQRRNASVQLRVFDFRNRACEENGRESAYDIGNTGFS